MCHADTTLMTFEWADGEPKPSMQMDNPPRMCVDWDAFKRDMKPKVIGGTEMDTLVNPNL